MKKLINFTPEVSTRDPFILKHNGLYYACFAGKNDSIGMLCAKSPEDFANTLPKTVYTAEAGKPWPKQLWAPELHILDGKCYIYVACDDGNNHNHRMYVLENNSNDPLDPYTLSGKIADNSDKWAIDGTVMHHGGKRYFIWSGWQADVNVCQNLYIAEMDTPKTLCSPRVLISSPQYDWEKLGATGEDESPFINEGPFVITLEGETYLLYSGAGSWCKDYCIAAMKLVGSDPMAKESWQKLPLPVFSANELVMGAGHCSAIEEEGDYCVFFHAWDKNEQVVEWNTVGMWQARLTLKEGTLCIE